MDKKVIARVNGISGNVKVRAFIKVVSGANVVAVETTDAHILYVDARMIEIMDLATAIIKSECLEVEDNEKHS